MKHSVAACATTCLAIVLMPEATFAQSSSRGAEISAPKVSVSGARSSEPLSDVLRPSEFMAPTPDTAQLLRTVPGFSLSRVGGAASDPLLRGLNGSRVQIVVDGDPLEGACSHRMDPPTSYLAADSFDRVTVTKGPSTVRFGPAIAGTVEFQRDTPRPERKQAALGLSGQVGSFDQSQWGADVRVGTPKAALRAYGTRAQSDNYRDGNGNAVHSFYDRYNAGASAALFTSDHSRVEFTAETGDGKAAYPTFHMDGTSFKRDRFGARAQVLRPDSALARIELRASYADIDHRMDDYSLRPPNVITTPVPGGSLVQTTLLNMDQTLASRAAAAETAWRLGKGAELLVGVDYSNESYVGRNGTSSSTCLTLFGVSNCVSASRGWEQYDVTFRRSGLFGEVDWWVSDSTRLKAGARINRLETAAGDLYDFIGVTPLPGANSERTQLGRSAFARAETELGAGSGWTGFAALGTAERPANALEVTSFSGFYLNPERNHQLDAGVGYAGGGRQFGVDAFVNRIEDYILIVQGTQSRNVDARMVGGEAYLSQWFGSRFRTSASYTLVRGDNLTDDRPLAQMPPHEFRIGAEYVQGPVTLGLSGRLVARQDRVDVGSGNVTGVDLGPSAGFGVWGVRAAWQMRKDTRLAVGIDNLFDRAYAEHLNRTGAFAPPGFVPTVRVNEPGRFLWIRLDIRFP